jgi:LacI family gluconate utilization system Gnt-I transcriptional repressor
VRRAAIELGYVQNFTASALSKRGSKLIALLVPNVANSVFSETINGLNDVLEAAGYALTIAHSGYSADREEMLIRTLLGYRPDALVLTGFTHTAGTRELLHRAGIPVVETWNIGPRAIDMAVGFSNFEAGVAITRYLIGKGHRRLAYHGGTQTDNDRTQARERGFRQALKEAGLPLDEAWVRSAPMELASGASLAREVKAALERNGYPQAIFIASDIIAAGFVLEASRIRLRVPKDIAIAGFDDTEIGQAVTPPLTSVHVPQREIGQVTATLLLQRLRKERVEEPVRDLGFSIIPRASA